ncbi:discoidin domain-containing protein [Paraflavitalea sp. CAU 1676]|uniref:discoidin domain-containing protein n=1 Tax=Paraflavitalea sp. CAU 1676 TaxID=3032598 RepID=UPI0023DC62FF|nr:discoidin domain-containing protein [Paraflavitalea sp. CAU 1676]MDF2188399.1 discoidin domain-containing protein [Paraflavitalea sp. CAU 1676]
MKLIASILLLCLLSFHHSTLAQTWSEVGPKAFPTNISGQIHGIGRVCQLKFHATNANRLYAVSASGGLWISNDAGANWVRTGSDTQIPQGSSASVCIDYTNDNILYLSSGDPNYYGNGFGIWKSTDGGTTWAASNAGIGNRMALEILMSPTDHNTLIAATTDGIWKSTDAGVTWTVKKSGGAFKDMIYKSGSSTILYAADNASFWRSADNGETWSQITSVAPAAGNGGRIAVSAANTNVVYVGFIGSNNSVGGIIYRSTDGGLNFTLRKGDVSPNLVGYDAGSGGQGNYNFTIFADRANADILYLGAHCNWKSTDGGATWTKLTSWWEKCHTDMHHIVTSPYNNSRLFNANDGGVFLSTDGGVSWSPSANGLSATEIYHMGSSKLSRNIIGIGTQDNGELYYNGTTWYCNRGGDWGSKYEFDYANTNVAYYIENATRRDLVLNGGSTGIGLSVPSNNDVYAVTALNTSLAFVGQATALRRSTNLLTASPTWSNLATFTANIKAIAIAPDNNNEVYVLTSDAKLYYSSNATAGSPSFAQVSTVPNSAATFGNLQVINSNTSIVYATAGAKIYRSTNKGVSWTDVSAALPSVNIIDLQHDKFSTNESIYIATAKSVQYRNSTTGTWQNISAGLPSIANITNLRLFNTTANNSVLRVSFYGRGVWELPVNNDGSGNQPPAVSITAPVNNSNFAAPANINFTVNATDANGTIAKVEYYNGGVKIGESSTAPFSFTWNNVGIGSYSVTAFAIDNGNAGTNSVPVNISVSESQEPCHAAIPRTQYSVYQFDSQETVGETAPATNAIDGDNNTVWHTQWYNATAAMPHHISIDLGGTYNLTKLRYLPRQSSSNGRINAYQVHTSINGSSWTLVATGNFTNTSAAQDVVLSAPVQSRYVRLTATSEVSGNAFTTVAELTFFGCLVPATCTTTSIPRSNYSVNGFDSQETTGESAPATNVIDGNNATIWHSQWYGSTAPMPHYITIDLGAANQLTTVTYVPRQSSANGRIKNYKIEVSVLGQAWFTVAQGTWPNNATTQTVSFGAIQARYVRLTATSEVNNNPWTSVAELSFAGCGAAAPSAPIVFRTVKGDDLVSYPVPTKGMVTVKLPSLPGRRIDLEVFDMQGKLMKKESLGATSPTVQVNLSNMASGQYILVVKDESGTTYTTRLLKE